MRMASGAAPPCTAAAMAAATGTPGRAPAMSPTLCTVDAPCWPSAGAIDSVSVPHATASTVPASSRALVSSSRETGRGLPSATSASTQMVDSAMSDHLQLLEERHDLGEGLALVLDDLARGAGLGLLDRGDLLARPALADAAGVDAEVGDLEGVDRLVLGGHDPLERRVAGLDHAGGHGDDRGERALDLVVAGLGLALDLDGLAVDLDVLGEGDGGQA